MGAADVEQAARARPGQRACQLDDIAEILLAQRLQAQLALIFVDGCAKRLFIDRALQSGAFVPTSATGCMPSGQAGALRDAAYDATHMVSLGLHRDVSCHRKL